jgi:hypothetical protein
MCGVVGTLSLIFFRLSSLANGKEKLVGSKYPIQSSRRSFLLVVIFYLFLQKCSIKLTIEQSSWFQYLLCRIASHDGN